MPITRSIPHIDNLLPEKVLSKYPKKVKRFLTYETLDLDKIHYNEELMSHEEAKEKGLPYAEPYEYKSRTLYKLRNTHMFSVMAKQKQEKKKYNPYVLGSEEWGKLALRELYRSLYGYKCGALEITGYHYFFLNYSLVDLTEVIDGRRITSSKQPNFWKIHYDWFWSVEIAENGISEERYNSLCLDVRINKESLKGKKHLVCVKTRRAGWSFLSSSMVIRDVVCTDLNYLNFKLDYIIASVDDYVSDLFAKIIDNKSYVDKESDYMFRHFYDRYDTKTRIRASEKDAEGVETITGGEAIGTVINKNAKKARGKGVYKIFGEEFGVFPAGTEALASILPLVQPGGIVTGMFIGFGTGGEETKDITALSDCFNNPSSLGMMEFDNSIFEEKATHTGFFVPVMYTNRRFLDVDGNPDLHKATEFQLEVRRKQSMLEKTSIVKFKAEEPMQPSDVFNLGSSDNPFTVDNLVDAKVNIESQMILSKRQEYYDDIDKEPAPYYRYKLELIFDGTGKASGVKAVRDNNGHVYLKEAYPETINGKVPDYLYIAGVDSIDVGIEESVVGKKGSKISMTLKKRVSPFIKELGNTYVGFINFRANKVETCFDEILKLSILFNATINLERSKIRIVNHFKKSAHFGDQSHRFSSDILAVNADNKSSNLIGTAPTAKNNSLMDSYLGSYIDANAEGLSFLPLIEECLLYSPSKRTKFDAIVAAGLTEIYDESLLLGNKVPKNPEKEITQVSRYVYKTINGKRVKVREDSYNGMENTKQMSIYEEILKLNRR